MKFTAIILSLTSLLFSCKAQEVDGKLFSLPNDYRSLDDSSRKLLKSKFEKGHVENFSINDQKFRFKISADKKDSFDLQVFQNKKWITNLTLAMPKYGFNLHGDIDLDKYHDLHALNNTEIKVYYFDKEKEKFSSDYLIVNDYALLDSNRLIYGNNRHGSGWNIEIFSIKNHIKRFLFAAKISYQFNPDWNFSDALIYKCNNGLISDTVLIDKININKKFEDFSLFAFMKNIVNDPAYR